MRDVPFGFGSEDPDERGERKPSEPGGNEPGQPGSGFSGGSFDVSQFGQMLSQLGQMLSQTAPSGGPVNYDLARQMAVQQLAGKPAATAEQGRAVCEAVHLAETW